MDDRAATLSRCGCLGVTLIPERSVPVAGFSRELRRADDAERYWFAFALRGGADWPVHVVFSPSARRAEIKSADLKVQVFEDVDSACEAKRRWISWWRGGRTASAFSVPRRAGRAPAVSRAPS